MFVGINCHLPTKGCCMLYVSLPSSGLTSHESRPFRCGFVVRVLVAGMTVLVPNDLADVTISAMLKHDTTPTHDPLTTTKSSETDRKYMSIMRGARQSRKVIAHSTRRSKQSVKERNKVKELPPGALLHRIIHCSYSSSYLPTKSLPILPIPVVNVNSQQSTVNSQQSTVNIMPPLCVKLTIY